MPREFFTVDLRGLRAALAAHAAKAGMTASDVLRAALTAALNVEGGGPSMASNAGELAPTTSQVKLSVRIPRAAADRLDHQVHAAGLSRGAYLTGLIDGAPAVVALIDRQAGFAALSASATELALLSRDLSHLNHLLRDSNFAPAREYRERLATLDIDVRRHLDRAAAALAEVAVTTRRTPSPRHPFNPSRSPP